MNILGYMRDLEDKLSKRKYCEFDSSVVADIKSDEELNNAARIMMDFVGLEDYVPESVFAETDKNIGGYTYVF